MAVRRSLDSGRAEYEARLQELFEESDVSDKGFLDIAEAEALCSRLQLGRLKDKVLKSLEERTKEKEKVIIRNLFIKPFHENDCSFHIQSLFCYRDYVI